MKPFIRRLEVVKLDDFLFESELDHRDTIVNDIRIVPDPERYLIEYTVTKPLSGVHEKNIFPIDSPNYSVRVYRDETGIHLEAFSSVDGTTIGYNENGEIFSLTARPNTDETTIEYNEADKLRVKGPVLSAKSSYLKH